MLIYQTISGHSVLTRMLVGTHSAAQHYWVLRDEVPMLGLIPTKIHGVIDYLTGVTLLAAPYLFGFADGTAAQWVPTIIGLMIIGQSLITRYELSMAKIIPMPTHLMLDAG